LVPGNLKLKTENFIFAEPFTPRGIAAFARAGFSRLLLVQLVVALLATVSLAWFLDKNCFSTVAAAIERLPDTGKIVAGRLEWREDSPQMILEGRLLAFDVDLDHSGRIHSAADVQIEFGRESMRIYSFLGYSDFFYPLWPLPFNRVDLKPRWGAWSAEILALGTLGAFAGLLLSWTVLATLYFLPAWLLGFFLNRDLKPAASWRLSAAALLPGALLMVTGILLYNIGFLNLISLSFIFAGHFVVGWIYLVTSLFFVPRLAETGHKKNPFTPASKP